MAELMLPTAMVRRAGDEPRQLVTCFQNLDGYFGKLWDELQRIEKQEQILNLPITLQKRLSQTSCVQPACSQRSAEAHPVRVVYCR